MDDEQMGHYYTDSKANQLYTIWADHLYQDNSSQEGQMRHMLRQKR